MTQMTSHRGIIVTTRDRKLAAQLLAERDASIIAEALAIRYAVGHSAGFWAGIDAALDAVPGTDQNRMAVEELRKLRAFNV